jgi:hypothetical protein
MSYALGPEEGWIAEKRNRLALALFEELPPELKAAAVREFSGLVNTGRYGEAADILTGSAWRIRQLLLSSLNSVQERHRQALASILYRRGYDLTVPGIRQPDPRPWH